MGIIIPEFGEKVFCSELERYLQNWSMTVRRLCHSCVRLSKVYVGLKLISSVLMSVFSYFFIEKQTKRLEGSEKMT